MRKYLFSPIPPIRYKLQIVNASRMLHVLVTSYMFELRHLLKESRIIYLTRFKLQVTRYYSQVTSRRTSYKFEVGHLLEE
jgi:hypothetical protein